PADVEASQNRRQAHAAVTGVAADHQEDERVGVGLSPAQGEIARAQRLVTGPDMDERVAEAHEVAPPAADDVDAARDVEDSLEPGRKPAVGEDQVPLGGVVQYAGHDWPDVVVDLAHVWRLRVEGEAERIAVARETRAQRG